MGVVFLTAAHTRTGAANSRGTRTMRSDQPAEQNPTQLRQRRRPRRQAGETRPRSCHGTGHVAMAPGHGRASCHGRGAVERSSRHRPRAMFRSTTCPQDGQRHRSRRRAKSMRRGIGRLGMRGGLAVCASTLAILLKPSERRGRGPRAGSVKQPWLAWNPDDRERGHAGQSTLQTGSAHRPR